MTGAFPSLRRRLSVLLTHLTVSRISSTMTRTVAIILLASLLPAVRADCWFDEYVSRPSYFPLYSPNTLFSHSDGYEHCDGLSTGARIGIGIGLCAYYSLTSPTRLHYSNNFRAQGYFSSDSSSQLSSIVGGASLGPTLPTPTKTNLASGTSMLANRLTNPNTRRKRMAPAASMPTLTTPTQDSPRFVSVVPALFLFLVTDVNIFISPLARRLSTTDHQQALPQSDKTRGITFKSCILSSGISPPFRTANYTPLWSNTCAGCCTFIRICCHLS
jgi:hypothetical protein